MFLVPSNKRSILNSTLSFLQQEQQEHNNHHQTPQPLSTLRFNHSSNHHHITSQDNRLNLTISNTSIAHLKSFKKILKFLIRSTSTFVCKFLLNSIFLLKRWTKLSIGVLVAILNSTTTVRHYQNRPLASITAFAVGWPTIYSGSESVRSNANFYALLKKEATLKISSKALERDVIETIEKLASSREESLSSDSEYNYRYFYNGTYFSGTNYKQRGFGGSNNKQQLNNNNLECYEGMDSCRRKIAQRTSSLNTSISGNTSGINNNNNNNNNNNHHHINNNHVDPNSAAACFWRLHSLPQASSNGASAVRSFDDGEEARGNSWNQCGNASAEGHHHSRHQKQRQQQLIQRDRKQAEVAIVASSQTPIEHFQGQQQQQTGLPLIENGVLSSGPEIGERLYKYDLLLSRRQQQQQQQSKHHQLQKQEVFFQKQQQLQQRQQARIVDKHDLHSNQPAAVPNNFDFNLKYFTSSDSVNGGEGKNITTDCITHSPSSTLMSSLYSTTTDHQARLKKQQQQTQKPYSYNLTVATTAIDNENVSLEDDVGGRSLLVKDLKDDSSSNYQQQTVRNFNEDQNNDNFLREDSASSSATAAGVGLVVVSKRALSNITDQIAFSMSRMKDLEEQVRVIPELQRKLEHVMSDVASSTTSLHTTPVKHLSNNHNQNNNHSSNHNGNSSQQHFSQPLDCGCQSFREHLRYNYNSISREQRLNHYMKSQTLSSANNSLNGINGNYNYNHLVSPIRHAVNSNNYTATNQQYKMKVDASTSTELSMSDIVTRLEVDSLVATMRKTYSSLNSSSSMIKSRNHLKREERNSQMIEDDNVDEKEKRRSFVVRSIARKSSSSTNSSTSEEATTSGSISGPKSSSVVCSRTDSCEDDARVGDDDEEDGEGEMKSSECCSNKCIIDENEDLESRLSDKPCEDEISDGTKQELQEDKQNDCNQTSNFDNHEHMYGDKHVDDDDDDDELEDEENGADWLNGDQEPYSLGSSYHDPSDFEEYCAYGESLDRRTRDFMSQSTKIPNDLRFALIRLNDFIRRNKSFDQIKTSSSCIEVIRKEWFEVTASKDSQALKTKLYVDYFESFTKQLLNTVVNLTDSAGNTAMHYAASHYKLDIIKVLLETKVCDVNCRNRAGYTPIMLLALAEIDYFNSEHKEIAKQLFLLGDVNIKARTSGQTALMLAASHGRQNTCKLLLECGADPSLQDYDGSTALMCGSEIGNEEVVRCLLANKLTDPSAVDNDGLDALTIAMNNGHKSIGLMLYAAKNVPRMNRFTSSSVVIGNNGGPVVSHSSIAGFGNQPDIGGAGSNTAAFNTSTTGYLGASLRRSRAKLATNYVRRADSLLGSRSARATIRH